MAWGEFDIKKESLNIITVVYFTANVDPNIWEVCDYQDRYKRVSTDIPFAIAPCQPKTKPVKFGQHSNQPITREVKNGR